MGCCVGKVHPDVDVPQCDREDADAAQRERQEIEQAAREAALKIEQEQEEQARAVAEAEAVAQAQRAELEARAAAEKEAAEAEARATARQAEEEQARERAEAEALAQARRAAADAAARLAAEKAAAEAEAAAAAEEAARLAVEEEAARVQAETDAAAAAEAEAEAAASTAVALPALEPPMPERVTLGSLLDAVQQGHVGLVRQMLKEKVTNLGNICQPADNGPTPLHWAASHGRSEIVEVLLEGSNNWAIVTQQEDGKTPLHLACIHRQPDIATMMIDQRPPRVKASMLLGMRDDNERTALLCACCIGGNAKCATLLVQAGADVNAQDVHGVRPLHFAAMQGDGELAAALLKDSGQESGQDNPEKKKIDVDAVDGQGRTALICATVEGHTEVVKLLIDSGANRSLKDRNGADALEWAIDLEHYEIVKLLDNSAHGPVGED